MQLNTENACNKNLVVSRELNGSFNKGPGIGELLATFQEYCRAGSSSKLTFRTE